MEALRQHARPGALHENDLLTARAEAAGHATPLEPWDLSFWAEREREARFAFRDEEVRPYFSLDNILSALFSLCHELFGVEIAPASNPPQTWHPDVRVYDVREPGQADPIATVYLDPYARPADKRGGAWMSPLVNRSGGRRPVCVIACNLPPPTDEAPSLPGPRGARTLFHELGHALQHMLTEVEEVGAAGIRNVEWDAVELPSMFMENWLDHRPVLQQIAHHYETNEPMPEALVDRLLDARRFRAAPAVLTQVSYALQDLAIHSLSLHSDDPFAVAEEIRERVSVTPSLPSDRWLCSFQHIFAGGYAAGYYSYLWAEVLSADAFAAFEEDGLDDSAVRHRWGRRFRSTVLARGGSEHPLSVFQDFRGRQPSPQALLRHKGLVA
jgi:oligopeptidase A